MNTLILINIFISSFMLGLILVTQIVSYPLFLKIKHSNFPDYHLYYTKKISIIAAPMMVLEFLIAANLMIVMKSYISIIIFLLILLIFFSTFFIQVPIHNKITLKADDSLSKKLVRTNWIRTVLWLLKCIFSFSLLSDKII